jgi:hypothetical protein
MTGRGIHRSATVVLSLAMAAIGVALIVQSLSGRGGAITSRLLLGALFIAAGAGRLYIEARRGRKAEPTDDPSPQTISRRRR